MDLQAAVEPLETYFLVPAADEGTDGRAVEKVKLVGVGDDVAYGVDYETGRRVVIEPLAELVAENRLVPAEEYDGPEPK
jgi:hypothetical protein